MPRLGKMNEKETEATSRIFWSNYSVRTPLDGCVRSFVGCSVTLDGLLIVESHILIAYFICLLGMGRSAASFSIGSLFKSREGKPNTVVAVALSQREEEESDTLS